MAVEGVDYSWSRPDPDELFRAGKRFALRYVSYSTTGKNITRSEVERLNAAGISVVTNWEWRAGDQLGGRDRGREHAREAYVLHSRAGGAENAPIYFSTDFDATAAQLEVCYQYLTGCAGVIGWDRVGCYGGYRTVQYMRVKGVRWLWQTYAWSGGRWAPGTHIQQYRNGVRLAGGDVDLDRALVDNYGQWTLDGMDGDSMAITDDDVKNIYHSDNIIQAPEYSASGRKLTEAEYKENPFWAPRYFIQRTLDELRQFRKEHKDKPVTDPVALAAALVGSDKAMDAIATAVAARVGMIPTAGEIGKSVLDQLKGRL